MNDNAYERYNRNGIDSMAFLKSVLTPEEFRGFCKGCALKYLIREGYKGHENDIYKAIDFLVYLRYATWFHDMQKLIDENAKF